MYVPKQFESPDRKYSIEIMRTHAFATLITTKADGEPLASHIPMVVSDDGAKTTLHFHLARANPHVNALREAQSQSTIVFLGPHAYMSPSVYPDKKRVPTWNYIAVHAYGKPVELSGEENKDALLKSLIHLHEPAYAEQWRGLDREFQSSLLNAIVAYDMPVTRLESKFKLNQHRKEAHATMKNDYSIGSANERALAEWMQRLGM
jgi:transcriptional regulator